MSKHLSDDQQRYAFMEWNPRWNKTEKHAVIHQDGHRVWLTTAMGTIQLDLSDATSINSYCDQMMSAVNLLLKTLDKHNRVMSDEPLVDRAWEEHGQLYPSSTNPNEDLSGVQPEDRN